LDIERPSRRGPREPREVVRRGAPVGLIIGLVAGGVAVVGTLIVVLVIFVGGSVEDQRAQQISENNLKQITLALIQYSDNFARMPPAVVYGPNGQPLYSWRVLILPYIEQQPLYQQFHLNEPWDSPHNMALLSQMPKTYQHPLKKGDTDTYYQV